MADNGIIGKLESKFGPAGSGGAIIATHSFRGDDTVTVKKENVVEVLVHLRDVYKFGFLMDLTAVDLMKKPRFEVVYHLYAFESNTRVRVKVPVTMDDCTIDSVSSFWAGANWLEREVWDMYGIRFLGHPDMRRILLYEEFEGHPLRKDYKVDKRQPLIGPAN